MTRTLYLVRHAEPVVQDSKKLGLTDRGRQQATDTSQDLLGSIDNLYDTSIHHAPVVRCAETAAVIGQHLNLPIIEAPLRLLGADALKIQNAQSKMHQYITHHKKLGIESPEAFTDRILEYVRQQPNNTIILIGNEVPLRLLIKRLKPSSADTRIEHGQYITLEGI